MLEYTGMRVLIVEDDSDIRMLLRFHLRNAGYTFLEAEDGNQALDLIRKEDIDLVILDIMLPGIGGIDILKYIRYESQKRKLPVIIASALTEDVDIVTALELGADDYITKPFSPRVLIAKIKSVLRRVDTSEKGPDTISSLGLTMNQLSRTCRIADDNIPLKATEFEVLFTLIERPEKVFTRKELIESIKGQDYAVTERSVDVQITSIRKKLGPLGSHIQTVWGIGYKWTEED